MVQKTVFPTFPRILNKLLTSAIIFHLKIYTPKSTDISSNFDDANIQPFHPSALQGEHGQFVTITDSHQKRQKKSGDVAKHTS